MHVIQGYGATTARGLDHHATTRAGGGGRGDAPLPGYGSCRGMESSAPPPTRTFPHPLEIPPPPPTLGIPTAPTAPTTITLEDITTKKGDTDRPDSTRCATINLGPRGGPMILGNPWSHDLGKSHFIRSLPQCLSPAPAFALRRLSSLSRLS